MGSRRFSAVAVTGGAGFIGSNFIRYLITRPDFGGRVINIDKLTYAGNPMNLADIDATYGGSRYSFERVDIVDGGALIEILQKYDVDTIVHFAAESHVDRSITGPSEFVRTNVVGTFALLEAARTVWQGRDDVLYHHVSTDEVYGSLGSTGAFTETTPYDPRSPYSASKAASDHFVRAYHHTYGLPVTISNCSNNYGPYQFPEKLIPFAILNLLEGRTVPVYGDGKNVRDWLFVEDHASAVWSIVRYGAVGESYNVGGESERENVRLVETLCDVVARCVGGSGAQLRDLIAFVKDRPGHDYRYAMDCSRLKRDLGWASVVTLEDGLERTVRWYVGNQSWVASVKSGEYLRWIETHYGVKDR